MSPSESEIIRAREVILDALRGGARLTPEELSLRVVQDGGGTGDFERDAIINLALGPIDPGHPIILYNRLRLAAREALAAFASEGVVTPMAKPVPGGGDLDLPVGNMTSGGGWRGGTKVPADSPILAEAYRLSRRFLEDPQLAEITLALTSDSLEDLLGKRGARCFSESVLAFRRGLYLAAANLAAAASEAAWYVLAAAATSAAPGQAIEKAMAADNTAKVIELVGQTLRATPGLGVTVTELVAQGIYLRDLRNYAVHPRPSADQQRESQLTEAGSLVLLMMTRRYLERLRDAGKAAGLL